MPYGFLQDLHVERKQMPGIFTADNAITGKYKIRSCYVSTERRKLILAYPRTCKKPKAVSFHCGYNACESNKFSYISIDISHAGTPDPGAEDFSAVGCGAGECRSAEPTAQSFSI